jgi:hypothetical protein
LAAGVWDFLDIRFSYLQAMSSVVLRLDGRRAWKIFAGDVAVDASYDFVFGFAFGEAAGGWARGGACARPG